MSVRVQVVLSDEERAAFAEQAAVERESLSAWLRKAGRKRIEEARKRGTWGPGDLDDFFAECTLREAGREPDWEQNLAVIEASRRSGGSETWPATCGSG